MFSRLLIISIGALTISSVNASFRMSCTQPVVIERADPIVTPGSTGPHVHTVVGGSAFNLAETYDQARSASCSSCPIKKDLSNYWVPSLYYQAQNGSFHPVAQVGGMTIYYLQRRGNSAESLVAFPPGFRMVAGDPRLRSYDSSSLAQRAINFVCLNFNTGGGSTTPNLPNTNCPDGVRGQVFLPSCWDGVNLDSANHKSHVAYPSNVDSGTCPPTHPIRFISLFYEIFWRTGEWSNLWWHSDGSQPFILSNGDPTGYGFHGDFLNGWDINILQAAINGCNSVSGNIGDCQPPLELFTDSQMRACTIPRHVSEQIDGWIPALPGCNPVQGPPGPANPQC